jgi:small GTP-binding protein
MSPLKVVVTGPVSAGKTTFVRGLSDEQRVETEATTTDSTEKQTTTVGLDLGIVDIAGTRAKVFGTPGQKRFEYLRTILAEGADGFILLYPADKSPDLDRSSTFLRRQCREMDIPVVVGITRMDRVGDDRRLDVWDRLEPLSTAMKTLDARDRSQCLELLNQLVAAIQASP